MGFELVTGHKGSAHVTSDQVGAFNTMIFGSGRYVLDVGEQFETELVSANTFNIKSGQLIDQGRQMAIDYGDIETVTLDNGVQGLKRIDIVCAVYSNDTSTEIESGSIQVIKGTPSATPTEPTYSDKQGNILAGATSDYFPLFKVTMDGLAISTIEPMFEVTSNFATELNNAITQAETDIADTITQAETDFASERADMQSDFDDALAGWNAVESSQQVQTLTDAMAVDDADNLIRFGIDASGNYGYKKVGADTVIPFKPKQDTMIIEYTFSIPANTSNNTELTPSSTKRTKSPYIIGNYKVIGISNMSIPVITSHGNLMSVVPDITIGDSSLDVKARTFTNGYSLQISQTITITYLCEATNG